MTCSMLVLMAMIRSRSFGSKKGLSAARVQLSLGWLGGRRDTEFPHRVLHDAIGIHGSEQVGGEAVQVFATRDLCD